jgi:glycosyltransferase involved in cell wall biosynthesis
MDRIATFIPGLGVGGAEIALLRLIESTSGQANHIVVSFKNDQRLASAFKAAGAEILQFNLNPRNALPVVSRLREFAPQAMVGQMYYGCILAFLLRPLVTPRSRLIFSVHHSVDDLADEKFTLRSAIRATVKLSRFADCCHFVAKRAAEQHRALGLSERNVRVVPNGIDFSSWAFSAEQRTKLRGELGFAPDDFVFGHMARYHPMKDHATFLRALELAFHENPRIGAIICGDGTYRLDVPPVLEDRVRILGRRRDVPALMSACDAGAVSSSYGEAIPTVIWEFYACGRLCVATDVGDCADMIRDDELIAPPRDPARLAAVMVRLSLKPPAELTEEGAAARAGAVVRVDLATVARRMMSLWTGRSEAIPPSEQPAVLIRETSLSR